MLGLVNRSNDISLSRTNQSQAKFKSAVAGNLLQSWVNLTIAAYPKDVYYNRFYGPMSHRMCHRAVARTSDVTYVCTIGLRGLRCKICCYEVILHLK